MKSSRRLAREFALQGLYQWQLSANALEDIERHLAEAGGFARADHELFTTLLRGAAAEAAQLTAEFAPLLDRAAEDLSPIERSILLIAAFELKHQPQTPYRVVLNEAIELAKAYGATDGHKYVNGVLDRLAAKLRPELAGTERSQRER
ncbi:MAG TPA: transcription antitermination factor NusB [Rhodocyclaceae bacterium]|nr:MAG: N utilization substance protein B [Betaproteobacteria bacterium CG2_30_68_42]PIV76995.1 MAG: transcription antitermination factor NusB [Rhodocyclales bacterium CG17_big_fil_post_rev_8_21_14_2_50_68_7]PIX76178.1 MAG: transcription antitermination factor NusB [Rhodocyclales bacterium CG_4_10_14_3_um_filter_68_10]PJA58834.1 MAG: transcription antitermination factor NusB [Rhodocyclales bacterium CG_4_9_14_3_um_filter_68_10]HCX32322.1 transcription antitermination factor NusB [Rhodocyclaceae